jgi:hypothetical protein
MAFVETSGAFQPFFSLFLFLGDPESAFADPPRFENYGEPGATANRVDCPFSGKRCNVSTLFFDFKHEWTRMAFATLKLIAVKH